MLRRHAVDARLEELGADAPTSAGAALAIGCGEAEIVETHMFVCDGLPVVALIAGGARVDEVKLATVAAVRKVRPAEPAEAFAVTGFDPRAVAPFPVPNATRVLVDKALLSPETVWIGAGTFRHWVGLAPADLMRVTGAQTGDLAAD